MVLDSALSWRKQGPIFLLWVECVSARVQSLVGTWGAGGGGREKRGLALLLKVLPALPPCLGFHSSLPGWSLGPQKKNKRA